MILFSVFVWLALGVYVCVTLWLIYGLHRPVHRPAGAMNDETPFASVVIAARNEARNLPDLLRDLDNQIYANFEVIIVDDRSTDATSSIVERFAQTNPTRFRLVKQTQVPRGASAKKMALHAGIEASCGELILLTDADCRVLPTWIEGITRAFIAPDVALILGFSELTTNERSTLFERWQACEFLTLVANMAASANLNHAFGASGQNIAYRRQVFDALGGYTSMLHRIAGDDMLMLEAVRRHPQLGRIVYADDARTYNRTQPHKSWTRFRSQRARWAASGTHHFQGDKLFMLYAVGSLVVNMLVLCGALWAWANWLSWQTAVLCPLIKFVIDWLFYSRAFRRFNRMRLLRYLPLWFITQPVYLLAMAYWGQIQKFTWKVEA